MKDLAGNSLRKPEWGACPDPAGSGSGARDRAAVISRLDLLERRMLRFLKKEEALW